MKQDELEEILEKAGISVYGEFLGEPALVGTKGMLKEFADLVSANAIKLFKPHEKCDEACMYACTEGFNIRAKCLGTSMQGASDAATKIALDNASYQKCIAVLEDLLASAYNIANRNGENTHWQRFAGQLHINGISPVTPKTFKILPSDVNDRVKGVSDERAKFEATFKNPPHEWSFKIHDEKSPWAGNYYGFNIQCAWEGG